MGCNHGHGYHGRGCWGPDDCRGDPRDWEDPEPGYGYRRGYAYGPRLAGRGAEFFRGTTASQLETYLATLQDELRAIKADLAAMRSGDQQGTGTPEV